MKLHQKITINKQVFNTKDFINIDNTILLSNEAIFDLLIQHLRNKLTYNSSFLNVYTKNCESHRFYKYLSKHKNKLKSKEFIESFISICENVKIEDKEVLNFVRIIKKSETIIDKNLDVIYDVFDSLGFYSESDVIQLTNKKHSFFVYIYFDKDTNIITDCKIDLNYKS